MGIYTPYAHVKGYKQN